MKNFPAGYVGNFYRNLADNVDNFLGSNFYGRIANDFIIPLEDVQKYILATSDFAKGMQTGISHYVMRVRINKASFREKLDPISKIIIRRQNPLELVFKDISTFDAETPIVGSITGELDVGKKDVANDLIKKAPKPPALDISLRNRLEKFKNRQEPKYHNDHHHPHHHHHYLHLYFHQYHLNHHPHFHQYHHHLLLYYHHPVSYRHHQEDF